MSLALLAEHQDFIIVNKPAGVPMHDRDEGIITRVRQAFGDGNWHLCHRLDTGTSGCLCLARNARAAAEIGRQFEEGKVSKYYLALTTAKPRKKQGTVRGDMKNRRDGKFILTPTLSNPAVTQFFSHSVRPGLRGFIVRPLTGKTHQIRVALKSLGSPILGDDRYGGEMADRLHLHAWQLSFNYAGEQINAGCLPDSGAQFIHQDTRAWFTSLGSPDSYPWPAVRKPSFGDDKDS
ncbi:TIGR01621 family pseudouridine synthase [Alteromonas sp. CYL-A6]|uniref:TIGR01621 family pseudouridine synthase n=1 Tax=Alteromonas nitratireducens TaxID=3390813 RepID=UPI0034AC04CE